MKTIRALALGTCALLSGTHSASALLVNGDFSAGFTGWSGVFDDGIATTPVASPPDIFTDLFDASGGAAVIATHVETDLVFLVNIFQQFQVEAILPGESLRLTYDLTPSLTDPAPAVAPFSADTAFATLDFGAGFANSIDLFPARGVDITFLSGQTVQLVFGVFSGFGDNLNDSLTVDNVTITRVAAPVQTPAPGTLGVMALGLGTLVARRQIRKSR